MEPAKPGAPPRVQNSWLESSLLGLGLQCEVLTKLVMKSCSIDGDKQCLEIEWETKKRSTIYWTDLCGLLPLPFEQELEVGEELCAWWHGRCHQVTYVSQEAATGPLRNWYDRNIIVRWCDEDIFVKCTHTWALA